MYLWHSPKVDCISEMKINCDLFCISLDLCYLCSRVMQMNNKIVNIVLAVIAVCLLALCVASVMNVK